MAYKWSTWFIRVYAARLIFYIISGIVFLIIASNNTELSDFFCDRYFGFDTDEIIEAQKETSIHYKPL